MTLVVVVVVIVVGCLIYEHPTLLRNDDNGSGSGGRDTINACDNETYIMITTIVTIMVTIIIVR